MLSLVLQILQPHTGIGEGRTLNEAEQLEVQVLEMTKKLLGAEHPDTLSSMENLATTYSSVKPGGW